MDDKMIIEESDNHNQTNYYDQFIDLYIKMFQLSQQVDILDQISILIVKIKYFKKSYEYISGFNFAKLYQLKYISYENQILGLKSKVNQQHMEYENLKGQEQIKDYQFDKNLTRIQVEDNEFAQQDSFLPNQILEQKSKIEKSKDVQIKYKCVQELMNVFQSTCILYQVQNHKKMASQKCKDLLAQLLMLEKQQLELIYEYRKNLLDEYAGYFKEQVLWEFPNNEYQNEKILKYIGFLIYKKVKDFMYFFDTSCRNCDINEAYLLTSILLFNMNSINQLQKTNMFENMIEMYTQQFFNFEYNTLKWSYSFQCQQNIIIIQLLQWIQIQKKYPQYQTTTMEQKIISLNISQQQLFLLNQLALKESFIQDLLNQIQQSQSNFQLDEIPQKSIKQLFIDITNTQVFGQSIFYFKRYFKIQNGIIPNLNNIPILYINWTDENTLGQTCFDGSVNINIFRLLKTFQSLRLKEFYEVLNGWIIKILIHEFYHYLLSTPELKKRRTYLRHRSKNDDKYKISKKKIEDLCLNEAGFIGEYFLYEQIFQHFDQNTSEFLCNMNNWNNRNQFYQKLQNLELNNEIPHILI